MRRQLALETYGCSSIQSPVRRSTKSGGSGIRYTHSAGSSRPVFTAMVTTITATVKTMDVQRWTVRTPAFHLNFALLAPASHTLDIASVKAVTEATGGM
jgi:hypothetical protein